VFVVTTPELRSTLTPDFDVPSKSKKRKEAQLSLALTLSLIYSLLL
jgi:hypothetical protein